MKKLFVWLGAVIVLFIVIFFAFNAYIYNEKQGTGGESSIVTYFQDQMIERGVGDIGQPIEGFDGQLLMNAFPGLIVADFEGVQTFEGHYEVSSHGQLAFVRDQPQPVSSAERTVSKEGYATLLSNISKRLSLSVETVEEVSAVIDELDTLETVEVSIGESATVFGVTISPLEVVEDSRCPQDVQCVWAGTLKVRALVTSAMGTAEQVFELAVPSTVDGKEITLVRVEPVLSAGEEVQQESAYVFHFEVAKQ